MRIAIISHNVVYGDGQGRVTLELAHALARRHEVHLFANRIEPALRTVPQITIHRVGCVPFTGLVKGLSFAAVLWFRLEKKDFEVIHNNGDAGFLSSTVNTCHFCHSAPRAEIFVGDPYRHPVQAAYQYLYRRFHARMERLVLRRSSRVVALSYRQSLEIERYAGVRRERIRVIYHGVDTTVFRPNASQQPPTTGPLRLLFVGDLRTRRKGADVLLRAFQQLRTPAVLTLVGETRGSPFLSMVEHMPATVRDRISFAGFQSDVAAVYNRHDLFVFPSNYDPFSLVTLEAMASGLPVLVSAGCGVADLIQHGTNGYLLSNPVDSAELAHTIDMLAADEDLRRSLGRAARLTAEAQPWSRMADTVEALYREVIAERAARS